jgi:Tol biopolymer transport system component/DNA-binding winged helix-turn-helix (wHTH) protein
LLKEHALLTFGEFSLDPVAKVLFRGGEPVHMTRKAVETLLVLVEHPGQVLTKEEIIKAVWPDRVVDEANLAQNIAVVRRTLGVAKGSPAFIETFAGRGYRLEGPVVASQGSGRRTDEPVTPTVDALPVTPAPAPAANRRRIGLLPVAVGITVLVAVAVAVTYRTEPGGAERESNFRVVPVTRMPGKEWQPALSPDGGMFAFVAADEAGSQPSVWISTTKDPAPRKVSNTAAHHSSPDWSADGQRLMYLRLQSTGTRVVVADVASGREIEVATLSPPDYGFEGRMLSWSPDGQSVAISHADAPGRPPGIWLVSVGTGEARPLTRPGATAMGDLDPRFSPDGKKISFIRMMHRLRQEVFSVPAAGGEAVQITRQGKRISSHDWMNDGRSILIASDRDGEFRVWRMPAEAPTTITSTGIYSEFPIQLSAARKAPALVYSSLHQDRDIWRLDLKSAQWKRVVATTAQDASPVYSPAGDRIVFRSDRSGDEQLWVSSADGAHAVQVTRGEAKPSVGRWSPDGRSIVFNNPQTFEIFVTEESASGWRVRNTGQQGVHPVFSADGKSILAGGSTIVQFPVAGGPPRVLAEHRGEALQASADGKFLYFVREPSGSSVWRIAVDARGPAERVFDGLVPGCTSCWSLAADGVYYLGMDKETFDRQAILFHAYDGSGPDRVVVDYPEPLWPQGSGPFSLSPDRSNLLCVRVRPSNSDVMLISSFR